MMNSLFRVALIGGSTPRTERLIAGLSPRLHPRVFPNWRSFDPAFDPGLVAILPGFTEPPPGNFHWSLLSLASQDLEAERSLEARLLGDRGRPGNQGPLAKLLGTSPAMARVRGLLAHMAPTPHPILLMGENGTGKELAAAALHALSPRKEQTMIAVNCGAVPPALAESEFFGSVRGAFTGAENRTGYCQQARGSTLFLDEVGELPMEIQAKLLRVLENHELRRVGSPHVETTDFRLICATNRDLQTEVERGRFREDLYYRINVLPIRMPPLRDRKEDLPVLIDHFLQSESLGRNRRVFLGKGALAKLANYHWPGNLRQLRNVICRAAILHGGPELTADHLELG